ncbi:hypothetical protein F2Q68_00033847 [Brassica cretica]|uniref:Uncharacterized protein n=1 Tax=Brassica cretica TaxID=69181 RepID=A0A8S9GXI2_BRACR|nr:hypothetical protein F2Q68_00033847 [Brassica cretica]
MGCESLVCDSRFSIDVCPSDSGFGVVSQVRDPKHPWPPPGFFLFDEQSGRGWCIVMVQLSLVVIICGWFRFIIVQTLEQKEIMMMRNGWDKQKNANAMDNYNGTRYLLQRKCLGWIAM